MWVFTVMKKEINNDGCFLVRCGIILVFTIIHFTARMIELSTIYGADRRKMKLYSGAMIVRCTTKDFMARMLSLYTDSGASTR